jgi:hypothetical protein
MSSSHAEGAQGASTTKRPLWRQTVMVCNSQGGEEAFTVGPDGCVWNFFPDSASDSGYNLVNLHMPTDALAVGHDDDGRMVVFSAAGMTLSYRVEQPIPARDRLSECEAGPRWSALMQVALPAVRGAVAVKRLFMKDIFGSLHIGAVVRLETEDSREVCVLAYAKWTPEGLTFRDPSILLDEDTTASPGCLPAAHDSRFHPGGEPAHTLSTGTLPLRSVLLRPRRDGHITQPSRWF